MRNSGILQPSLPALRFAPWRAPLAATIVVLLLSALLAGAILAALQPHPLVDAAQAAIQGGL